MVNIFAYRDQHVNSRACYLPDKPQTAFCLANIATKQQNNADFSVAIDEKLTLLQSLVSAARPAEITIYNQQQPEEQEKWVATDIVVSTNLPCCITEITSYPRQPGYQYHASINDTNKKHFPTNRLSLEKYSIVIDPAKNRQMGAETGRLIVAKPLNSDSHHGTEPKTTPKPLLVNDGNAYKSVSRNS